MNIPGNIVVSWPNDDAFDFSTRFSGVRPLLFASGFDSRAVISGSFLLFAGTQAAAKTLAIKIAEIDLGFIVEWEPEKRKRQA